MSIFQKIHIVMKVTSPSDATEAVKCLKTILHFRSRPLALHLLVDHLSHHIFTTLFDTWQLPMSKKFLFHFISLIFLLQI